MNPQVDPSLTPTPVVVTPQSPTTGPSPPTQAAPEPPPSTSFNFDRLRLKALASTVGAIILIVTLGLFLSGRHSPAPSSQQSQVAGSNISLAGSNPKNLDINFDTVISDGKQLKATGPVLVQNQADSAKALVVQDSAASSILAVDTANGKVGIGLTPSPSGATLQIAGDVLASTTLFADGGSSSLDNQGLRINAVTICTANGCKALGSSNGPPGPPGPSGVNGTDGAPGPTGPAGPSGVASCPNGPCASLQAASPGIQEVGNINISGTIVAGNFSGDGTILGNVDAASLQGENLAFFANAANLTSGTLSDARLSANVALLNASQTFSGNSNIFKNASNSTTAFQIQNASSVSQLVIDTTNQRAAIGPNATPANGILTIGTNTTTASGGVYLGTDTYLYRSGVGAITTSGQITSGGAVLSHGAISIQDATSAFVAQSADVATRGILFARLGTDTQNRLKVDASGTITWGSGSLAGDTDLYRSGVGALMTDGTFQVAATLGIGAAPSANRGINLSKNFGSSPTDQSSGASIQVQLQPSGAFNGAYATTSNITIAPATSTTSSYAVAGFNQAYFGGTGGTVTSLYGTQSRTAINGVSTTGTVGNGYALYADSIANQATGVPNVTFQNQFGLYVQNQGLGNGSGGLTIQNAYGLYLAAQSGATTSTYSIYSAGGQNYLAGNLGIGGATNPAAALQLGSDAGTAASGIKFGSTGDTDLYRNSANSLKTDGAFEVASDFFVDGSNGIRAASGSSANTGFDTRVSGDSQNRFNINLNGDITWGTGSAARDIQLSRSGVGDLTLSAGNAPVAFDVSSTNSRLTVDGANANGNYGVLQGDNLITSATGNLYLGAPSATTALKITSITGAILAKNASDSATAFQVQNANANNYILVDTLGATLSLGNTGIASTIQIGNTTGAVAQTINIGNNTTSSSTTTITVGSTVGTSGITIQSGTGRITLVGQVKVAQSGTALSNSNLAESGAGTATLGAGSVDTAGSITTSTVSHTTVTLTFGATMTNAPYCVITPGNAAAAAIYGSATSAFVTTTATTMVINTAADTTAAQWMYYCVTH